MFASVRQTREVQLEQPHTELRLLPASRGFHKARKRAVLGSSDREAAPGHTQEQFLVRRSRQQGAPRPSHASSMMKDGGKACQMLGQGSASIVAEGHREVSLLKISPLPAVEAEMEDFTWKS